MTAPIVLPPQPGFGDSIQAGLAPLLTMIQHRRQLDIERQKIQQEQQRIDLLGQQVKQAGEMDASRKQDLQSQIEERTQQIEARQNAHAGLNVATGIFGSLQGRGLEPGQPAQPEVNGEPGLGFDAAAIQELAKHANKPYYGDLVTSFHKLLDENVTNQQKIALAKSETAQAGLDQARAEGEKRAKALDAWKQSEGQMTLGDALRSYGADVSSFAPGVLAQRSQPAEGKFSKAGVSARGNLVTLNEKTGATTETKQPMLPTGGTTAKVTQEKVQLATSQALGGLDNAESRYKMLNGKAADQTPWMAALAGGLASYGGKGEAGTELSESARQSRMASPQQLFQSDMNQMAHALSGLLGGQRSVYIYNSLLGTYRPHAGATDETRAQLRVKRQQLRVKLLRLKRGDMSALADIEGIAPEDVQMILNGGPSNAGASPLDAGMAPDIQ